MANTLTGLIPTIIQALDVVSREQVGFIPAVFRNATAERAALNQPVTYPITGAATAMDITAAVTAPNSGDQTIGNGTITITKSRGVPVRWNGEEQKGAMNSGWYAQILGQQFQQAFRTLTNEMEADLAASYLLSSRALGTIGADPFGTANDLSDFAGMIKLLKDNGAGSADLKMVMNTSAAQNIRAKQGILLKVNESGQSDRLMNGSLGRVEGFDLGESAQIVSHAIGSVTGAPTATAAKGATSVTIATGVGEAVAIKAGDIVNIVGDTNNYIANADLTLGASASGALKIALPGLLKAAAGGAVSVTAAYSANMAFKSSAIHLVTRAPALPVDPSGKPMDMSEDIQYVTDPNTGIVFEIAAYKQFRQLLYMVSVAWGSQNVKPEHTGILIGKA